MIKGNKSVIENISNAETIVAVHTLCLLDKIKILNIITYKRE